MEMRKKVVNVTYLSHEAVRAGAFLVFENNVGIVIGHEIAKSSVVSGNSTLAKTTRRKGILADIWYMLFENEWREFS